MSQSLYVENMHASAVNAMHHQRQIRHHSKHTWRKAVCRARWSSRTSHQNSHCRRCCAREHESASACGSPLHERRRRCRGGGDASAAVATGQTRGRSGHVAQHVLQCGRNNGRAPAKLGRLARRARVSQSCLPCQARTFDYRVQEQEIDTAMQNLQQRFVRDQVCSLGARARRDRTIGDRASGHVASRCIQLKR
jgi:hypothetical protein